MCCNCLIFAKESNDITEAQARGSWPFSGNLPWHGSFGVDNDSAMTFLAQVFIGIGADEGDLEVGFTDLEFIAHDDIGGEFGDGMFDDHISESGADFLIHEDKARVALKIGWGVFADAGHFDFILNHKTNLLVRNNNRGFRKFQ